MGSEAPQDPLQDPPRATAKPPRKWPRKLALSLASTVLVLLFGELVVRLSGYGSEDVLQWRRDPDLQYLPAPNQQTWFGKTVPETGETPRPIRINAHGQRGADYPLEREEGETRLLGIGDSLTFGQGVKDEETYLARLEQRVEDPGVRVINAAVNGWATWHYRRYAETQLDRFQPDVLLVGIYPANDMEIVTELQLGFDVARDSILRYSALCRYASDLYKEKLWKRVRATKRNITLEEVDAELRAYVGVDHDEYTFEARKALWMRAIDEDLVVVRDECAARGVELFLVMIPHYSATEREEGDGWDALKGVLLERGFQVIDALPALRPHHEKIWLNFDHGHLSPAGHHLVADVLLRALQEHGVL